MLTATFIHTHHAHILLDCLLSLQSTRLLHDQVLCGMTPPIPINMALLVPPVTVPMPSTALQAARTSSVPSDAHVHVSGLGGPGQELSAHLACVARDVWRGRELALALAQASNPGLRSCALVGKLAWRG